MPVHSVRRRGTVVQGLRSTRHALNRLRMPED